MRTRCSFFIALLAGLLFFMQTAMAVHDLTHQVKEQVSECSVCFAKQNMSSAILPSLATLSISFDVVFKPKALVMALVHDDAFSFRQRAPPSNGTLNTKLYY